MKLNILLVVLALTSLLIGFNANVLTGDLDTRCKIYDLCDSIAWSIFSLFALLLTHRTKVRTEDLTNLRRLRIICEVFLVLSICPLINDIAGLGDQRMPGNFIFGGAVVLFYLTRHIVKKYRNARLHQRNMANFN